jgi:hypothetical protein
VEINTNTLTLLADEADYHWIQARLKRGVRYTLGPILS